MLRDNGLSIVVVFLFLLFLFGQTVTGWKDYNSEQKLHRSPRVSYMAYLGTGHCVEAIFENWESEFLQMGAYVVLTSFLFQRGSAESKDPDGPNPSDEDPEPHIDDPEAPGPVQRGGWALKLYKNSLFLAFTVLFLLSFVGHFFGSWRANNAEMLEYGQPPESLAEYIVSSHFWFESLQNWQSEFLAVASIVILSIRLRQYGSSESKPVAAPHWQTGD